MNYKEIEEIKKEFYLINSLQKKCFFECFMDKIFTYYLYEDNGSFHEISIINEHATFMKEERIIDLLELKGTFYLSHRYFAKLDKLAPIPFELICQKEFKLGDYLDDCSLN
ncbi:MAG: hypothetical protein KKD36_09900 [Bacteroidetes bacterium]|nr:hypothetical protein [Bacteroidota bacterium]